MDAKAYKLLKPVFVFGFVEALIFWYPIEKALWAIAGLSAQEMIVLGMIAHFTQVVFELPSSLLADRWSRRKSLMASSGAMAIAVIATLSAQNFWGFAVTSLFWSIYFSLRSGTLSAYIYDLLAEQQLQQHYQKAISRFYSIELSGLLIAALAGGIIADIYSEEASFLATLITTGIAISLLARMSDPKFRRTEVSKSVKNQTAQAVQNLVSSKVLLLVSIAIATMTAGRFLWFEYYQLIAVHENASATMFGVILVGIQLGNLLGVEIANRSKKPETIILFAVVLAALAPLPLLYTTNVYFLLVLIALNMCGSQIGNIVLEVQVQHRTESEIRATTLSTVGFASRLLFGMGALAIIAGGSTPVMLVLVPMVFFTISLVGIFTRENFLHEPIRDELDIRETEAVTVSYD